MRITRKQEDTEEGLKVGAAEGQIAGVAVTKGEGPKLEIQGEVTTEVDILYLIGEMKEEQKKQVDDDFTLGAMFDQNDDY